MKHQHHTKGLTLVTFCSLLLFILLIVIISMTPLSQTSSAANEFGSIGMFAAVGMITSCYLIPYLLFRLGFHQIKYVMAVFCGIGIITALMSGLSLAMITLFSPVSFISIIIPMIICGLLLLTNIIWYLVAFHRIKPGPIYE